MVLYFLLPFDFVTTLKFNSGPFWAGMNLIASAMLGLVELRPKYEARETGTCLPNLIAFVSAKRLSANASLK